MKGRSKKQRMSTATAAHKPLWLRPKQRRLQLQDAVILHERRMLSRITMQLWTPTWATEHITAKVHITGEAAHGECCS